MVIRYPWMFAVTESGQYTRAFGTYRPVRREIDRAETWFAPCWIAWLYRWLPSAAGWDMQAWKEHDSYFLVWLQGPNWSIGLRRKVGNFRWPMLCVSFLGWHGYIPWGAKFILARVK